MLNACYLGRSLVAAVAVRAAVVVVAVGGVAAEGLGQGLLVGGRALVLGGWVPGSRSEQWVFRRL